MGMEATGKGLSASPGLRKAQLNEDVSMTVNTEPKKKEGRKVTITSDGPMEIDQANNLAVFRDNVVAVQEGSAGASCGRCRPGRGRSLA